MTFCLKKTILGLHYPASLSDTQKKLQYSPPPPLQGRRFFFGWIWPNPRPTPPCKNPSPGFFHTSKVFWSIIRVKILLGDFQTCRTLVLTHRKKRRPWGGGEYCSFFDFFIILPMLCEHAIQLKRCTKFYSFQLIIKLFLFTICTGYLHMDRFWLVYL